jgi:hypothetical protein
MEWNRNAVKPVKPEIHTIKKVGFLNVLPVTETIFSADEKTRWLPHEKMHSCWEPDYNNIKNQFSNFQITISVCLFMTLFYSLC